MPLTVKLIGALRHASAKQQLSIDYEEGFLVKNLLNNIIDNFKELKQALTNQQDETMPNALILVNGKEISVLNGLETELNDNDEIVLIPVVHGG